MDIRELAFWDELIEELVTETVTSGSFSVAPRPMTGFPDIMGSFTQELANYRTERRLRRIEKWIEQNKKRKND